MRRVSRKIELRRLTAFAVVGALNTAICYALFALLVHVAAWPHEAALAADYAFGIVLGYLLHRASTFADRKHVQRTFGKYTMTLLAAFLANLVLLDAIVLSRIVGPLAGQALAVLVVTLASYAAQRYWVFRLRTQSDARPAGSANHARVQRATMPARRAA